MDLDYSDTLLLRVNQVLAVGVAGSRVCIGGQRFLLYHSIPSYLVAHH